MLKHSLTINVVGTPAPQGSKRAFQHRSTGKVVTVESGHKKVQSWRHDVQAAVDYLRTGPDAVYILGLDQLPMAGALKVQITFYLARPGYHYGTGRNAGILKPNAPAYVDKKPDVDKLARSTLDGLKQAGIYRDDSQVARLLAEKRYADAATGARITITPLDSPAAALPPLPGQQWPDAPTVGEAQGRPATTPAGVLF